MLLLNKLPEELNGRLRDAQYIETTSIFDRQDIDRLPNFRFLRLAASSAFAFLASRVAATSSGVLRKSCCTSALLRR